MHSDTSERRNRLRRRVQSIVFGTSFVIAGGGLVARGYGQHRLSYVLIGMAVCLGAGFLFASMRKRSSD